MVLDLGLPGLDGLEVCRRIQRERAVPVLMLTARGEESDRVRGLSTGADDYVVKPYSLPELSARVRALLRRGVERPAEPQLGIGPLTIDLVGHSVAIGATSAGIMAAGVAGTVMGL